MDSIASTISPPAPPATDSLKLLHLGSGRTAPPQWINVDGSWSAWMARHPALRKALTIFGIASSQDNVWPTNIVVADLRKKLPFPDASFDAMYSSHLLEHLHRTEAVALLKEVYRVLKPGGRCRNLVPDVSLTVQRYLAEIQSPPTPDYDATRQFIENLGMRNQWPAHHGFFYRIYSNMTDFHSHKWMYDAPALQKLMEEAAFVECHPAKFLETSIPYLDQVELPSRREGSAMVEGIKSR